MHAANFVMAFVLLGSLASTIAALEPTETATLKSGQGIDVKVYAPPKEKADGRVILLLYGGSWEAHPKQYDAPAHAARLVDRGCVVVAADLSGQKDTTHGVSQKVYEQMRQLGNKHAGDNPRLLTVAAGFDVADPILFYRAGKESVSLDLIYPVAAPPRPTLIRIYSGTFGIETAFDLVIAGFAQAVVRDPRNDLKLSPEAIGLYGAAVARALRANADKYNLSDKIGIFGLSKHGFCSGLIGARNTTNQPETAALNAKESGRIDAVGMFTDSYDPPTRAEDFKAAGHATIDDPNDVKDEADSPVRLLGKGAPAFLLTDAHRRPSKQYQRMIEALQKADVPFQQTWDANQPNYVKKTPAAIREFFRKPLRLVRLAIRHNARPLNLPVLREQLLQILVGQ